MENKILYKKIEHLAKQAKKAAKQMALLETAVKNAALRKMAEAIVEKTGYLIKENKKDLQYAVEHKLSDALLDRLTLNEKRVGSMAKCLLDTVKIQDPVGATIKTTKRPNGLVINKVRAPIGVIGIIYESRPNVTSDCIGLCLKSGNAVILKGGKEACYSNNAIYHVIRESLKETEIPLDAIQFLASTGREAVQILLKQNRYVDLIIPRGGEGLIHFVAEHSKIPVIKHYKGVCHTYVSDKADLNMANAICLNAKVQRPGVCNAMETMLVHKNIAKQFLPKVIGDLKKAGVEIRADDKVRKIIKTGIKKATVKDWSEEYLDLILSVRVVDNTRQAIEHISTYGSQHSDAIITKDKKEAEAFAKAVDSSSVFINTSTRFADGYEYGFGAEIGISTDKLHARGPMALEELTTYKYVVLGEGQIRT